MMWELIAANKRRSIVLIAAMGLLLAALGYLIGAAALPVTAALMEEDAGAMRAHDAGRDALYALNPAGGAMGMAVAAAVWLVQALIAFFAGDRILLASSRAKEIEKGDHPQLFNVVEEMTIAAALPKMPRVYVIDDAALNAFAVGRDPDHAAVAVTSGLLERLGRDQLQGVVAHEIAHIVHRDVLYMTLAGIMVGTVIMISDGFLRSLRHMGRGTRYRSSGNRKGGGGIIVLLVLALVLAIVAPLLAQMLYFALSRRREYLADAGGAVYTRYPEGLASALEVIAGDAAPLAAANRATAPMYIVNPFNKLSRSAVGLMSTHPPTGQRIAVLRSMTGASYGAYETAFQTAGAGKQVMPASALKAGGDAPIRAGSGRAPEDVRAAQRRQKRDTADMMHKLAGLAFVACPCGMKLKLPPELQRKPVACPRCGKTVGLPVAGPPPLPAAKAAAAPAGGIPFAKARDAAAAQPLAVQRAGNGWMTFKCACGASRTLSPSFNAPQTTCASCGRTIQVTG